MLLHLLSLREPLRTRIRMMRVNTKVSIRYQRTKKIIYSLLLVVLDTFLVIMLSVAVATAEMNEAHSVTIENRAACAEVR